MPVRFQPIVLAAAVAGVLATSLEARAASDYLLKLDGIAGESTLKGFEKQIEIQSFSWGVSQAGAGSGNRVGKSCPTDLNLSKGVDKATPPLISSAVGGTVSPTAILIGLRPGGNGPQPYIRFEMKNVLVSSYSTSGASGGGLAFDAFSLKFASATVTYYQQDERGAVTPVSSASFPGC
jgi:type VI secretion system secreted protein Hcp